MERRSFLKFVPVAALPIVGFSLAENQKQDNSWMMGEGDWVTPQCRYCAQVLCRQCEGQINHLRHYIIESHDERCKRFKFNGRKVYTVEPQ